MISHGNGPILAGIVPILIPVLKNVKRFYDIFCRRQWGRYFVLEGVQNAVPVPSIVEQTKVILRVWGSLWSTDAPILH